MKSFVSFISLSYMLLLVACQSSALPGGQLLMIPPVLPLPMVDAAVVTPTTTRFEWVPRTATPTRMPTSIPTATLTPPPTPTATTNHDDETSSSQGILSSEVTLTPAATATVATPTITPSPTLTPMPSATPFLVYQQSPGANGEPTLADFWHGEAKFVIDVVETGLPRGESDTIVMSNGEMWSYLHASDRAAGVVDQCGDPVAFPGCVIIYKSRDGGYSFQREPYPVCQVTCNQCPCRSQTDHIDQQQYPRVFFNGQRMTMFYEYRAGIVMRHSWDGLNWSQADAITRTGVWNRVHRPCAWPETIGNHPFAPSQFECLAGGPPGIYLENNRIYLFVGVGQNPGGMGCYVGNSNSRGNEFVPCRNHQLFSSAAEYGPLYDKGPYTNPYFDFRMVSSAEIQRIGTGEEARYYMLYEGIRGPGLYDDGDSQFGLGLARSVSNRIDGPWEKYPNNPIIASLPGNIGLGHADLVVYNGQTLLYTSLEGVHRSRLSLRWK